MKIVSSLRMCTFSSIGVGHGHSHNLQSKGHTHRNISATPILSDENSSDTPVAITGSESLNGSAKNNSIHDVGVNLHPEGTDEDDVFVTNGTFLNYFLTLSVASCTHVNYVSLC